MSIFDDVDERIFKIYIGFEDTPAHPDSPIGGGGPGYFSQFGSLGISDPFQFSKILPHPKSPEGRHITPEKIKKAVEPELKINGVIVSGGPLSKRTIVAVNNAATKVPIQWRRYVAYATLVKVGGSLAWRANNPGNLRDAPTKIGTVPGGVGKFAVFATLEDGREVQRFLYLTKYGTMKVNDAINKLTPPSENDTTEYLAKLKKAGVDLDKDVKSQIDLLMESVQANEGLIEGTEVNRLP